MTQKSSQKVRVADYLVDLLAKNGIRHVFLVTGGGSMHLNDAFGRNREMEYVACHHEQACAMAAESYARMSGRMAAVNVTTGPGGTNAITGVYGAYVDSVPMFVVSGQVKWETLVRSTNLPLRQMGDQEVDIIQIVKSITKFAEIVTDPLQVRYQVEKALYLARLGRPGPVWLDVPMNVQGALVDPAELKGFDSRELQTQWESADLKGTVLEVFKKLKAAQRPVVLTGAGVRLSGCHSQFLEFAERLGIPVTTAWNAHDNLWNSHPLYAGRPGTIGDRPGNFSVQNSDFLLVLGSRLNIRQISYAWQNFARHAFKVMVDVDAAELKKPTLKIDLPVHADLRDFFQAAKEVAYDGPTQAHLNYLAWCKDRLEKYPAVLPEYWDLKEKVNPYCFSGRLFDRLPENQLVVTGDGTACVVTFQAARLKKGQRLYTNSGCASMGYDLPGAVGACISMGKPDLVCIAGDGSIQMNLQELQTIVSQKLPLKIFVLNNQGYHSIRQTQHNYFPDNIVGCGLESGLGFPDMQKLSAVYGIPYRKIERHSELDSKIDETLKGPGPQLCEVILDLEQQFSPKVSSRKLPDGRMISAPLEDMAPFLSREELRSNLLIPMQEY